MVENVQLAFFRENESLTTRAVLLIPTGRWDQAMQVLDRVRGAPRRAEVCICTEYRHEAGEAMLQRNYARRPLHFKRIEMPTTVDVYIYSCLLSGLDTYTVVF